MQPYIFPYIGYFQLMANAEHFVYLDDVNYIKKGWINRNNVLQNNEASLFIIPVRKASQNKLIMDLSLSDEQKWKDKLMKTLEFCYKKRAPYYNEVIDVIDSSIFPDQNLAEAAISSTRNTLDFLNIETETSRSSEFNVEASGEARIIDLCKNLKATTYVNPIGGRDLYSKENFDEEGIELRFLKPDPSEYDQGGTEFVPNLSIIDVLMFNSKEEVAYKLTQFSLI